jgi:hypothetical protein
MLKKPNEGFSKGSSRPGIFLALHLFFACLTGGASAQENCEPVTQKPVKIEAWMAKPQAPVFKFIRNEFAEMGHTRVTLWVYPASENPSRIVAVGRCVPAYIARHVLRKAIEFSGGVQSLVHQGFVSSHWIGIATSLFAEGSLRDISQEQLDQLLDESLDTQEFHVLYRSFSRQKPRVKAFGLTLANPKLLKED